MKLKLLALLAVIAGAFGVVAMAQPTYAAVTCPEGSLRYGDTDVKSYAECNIPRNEANTDLMKTVINIINVIVGVVTVVAVAVIVVGAILFVVSTGEAPKIARAKNTILYGVVGLVISLMAFAIVNFALTAVYNSRTGGAASGGSGGAGTPAEEVE